MDYAPPPWLVRAEALHASQQTLKESAKLQVHIDSTKWVGRTKCFPLAQPSDRKTQRAD